MTKNQITRLVNRMSGEQKAHLAEQIKLRASVAKFMGKSVNEGKLNITLKALNGKAKYNA